MDNKKHIRVSSSGDTHLNNKAVSSAKAEEVNDKLQDLKQDAIIEKVSVSIQNLIEDLEKQGIITNRDDPDLTHTNILFSIAMELADDLEFEELSDAVTKFVDSLNPPQHCDESDELYVGLWNYDVNIGKAIKWNRYLNRKLFNQGEFMDGFAPVWFFEDKSEWYDMQEILRAGESLPISAIVDFYIMVHDFRQQEPHIESIQDVLRQNIETKGKYLNNSVCLPAIGETMSECLNEFDKLLEQYPHLFRKEAA